MTVTAPAASPEHLNELMIDAIAAARPVGTSDPASLTRFARCHATPSSPVRALPTLTTPSLP